MIHFLPNRLFPEDMKGTIQMCLCNRPWRSTGMWAVEAPTFSRQIAVRLSALRAGRPLSRGRILVFMSARCWIDATIIARLGELGILKTPMALSGTEPSSFHLVWQRYHLHPFQKNEMCAYQNSLRFQHGDLLVVFILTVYDNECRG
jgi:hypothetical protein